MIREKQEKKYTPEISDREIQDLKKTIKNNSEKVIADNIARMKKADPKRPYNMLYFDEIADLFGKRRRRLKLKKPRAKKLSVTHACLHLLS